MKVTVSYFNGKEDIIKENYELDRDFEIYEVLVKLSNDFSNMEEPLSFINNYFKKLNYDPSTTYIDDYKKLNFLDLFEILLNNINFIDFEGYVVEVSELIEMF